MTTKTIEIRDRAKTIQVAAIWFTASSRIQAAMLRKSGYGEQPGEYVALLVLSDGTLTTRLDPRAWPTFYGRTMAVAHEYVREHIAELRDGDVVDVEFILQESDAPKVAEWRAYLDASDDDTQDVDALRRARDDARRKYEELFAFTLGQADAILTALGIPWTGGDMYAHLEGGVCVARKEHERLVALRQDDTEGE